MWRVGSKLLHPFNPELGVGVVREIEDRFLVVEFPAVERELRMAAEGGGLTRLILRRGDRATLLASGEEVRVEAISGHRYRLADGREVDDAELWPLDAAETPLERLARLDLDPLSAFVNRMEGFRLAELREAGGLGSFLGGRIELFPHQLDTALRAAARDPVRWLLADEVGLGKTIEACLILSALVRTGRADRALVIAPGTLVVQWLGELYRKFHQVFVLLDHARIASVESDFGAGVNPFEVHPFGVIPLELLASDRRLLQQAHAAGLDLVVLDEAHRACDPRLTRELGPLVGEARHALLLTATPLHADREGFFRLFRMLHPDAFESFEVFERALETGRAVLRCTSSVRRADLGGLPPRVPRPVDLPASPGFAGDPQRDPRALWIAERVRGWLKEREKVLVFHHDTDELERLHRFLERATRTHIATFHERHSVARRDIEVARFRDTATPVLLCSDAGSEGRNFQFCDRMILYDLPDDPVVLEQRIGRLDRIGRREPVEILYFRAEGMQPDVAQLYERLDLFARPSAGLDAALRGVREAVAEARAAGTGLDVDALLARVEQGRVDARHDLPRVLYCDAYDPSRAQEIMGRVPPDLETRTRAFCLGAAEDLGLSVIEKGGRELHYIELGKEAKIDTLPGVPDGARYLGSFDREEAIRRDEIDFFASGHPLVEGLLLELEDGPRGRVALFETPPRGVEGAGLLCVYRDGSRGTLVLVDEQGVPRPEWEEPLLESLAHARPLALDGLEAGESWATQVRGLGRVAEQAGARGQLGAVAFFRPRR